MKRIVLIGTLDTKGEEVLFMKEQVEQVGHQPLVIDIGMVGRPVFAPDVTREDVLKEIEKEPADLVSLKNEAEAGSIMSSALVLFIKRLWTQGAIDAVIAIGGGQGSRISGPALQQLPIGVPKILVSSKAVQAGIRAYAGTKDVVIIPSVCDVAGLNRMTRRILANAVGAAAGMLSMPPFVEIEKPMVAMSMMGLTTTCGLRVKDLAEKDDYEVVVFHCIGPGGVAMEEFIRNNDVKCVLELALNEIGNEIYGGKASAGKHRLEAAGERGIAQIVVPGSVDIINFLEKETIPERYRHRRLHAHNPQSNSLRMEKEEMAVIAGVIAEKLNKSRGNVEVVIPGRGFSAWDGEGKVFYDPDAIALFVSSLKSHIRAGITVTELDFHINDRAFADFLYLRLKAVMKEHT